MTQTIQQALEEQIRLRQGEITRHSEHLQSLQEALQIVQTVGEIGLVAPRKAALPVAIIATVPKERRKIAPKRTPIFAKPAKPVKAPKEKVAAKPSALSGGITRVLDYLSTDPSKALTSGDISRTLEERFPDLKFKTYQNAIHYLRKTGRVLLDQREDDGWYYYKASDARNGASAAASV